MVALILRSWCSNCTFVEYFILELQFTTIEWVQFSAIKAINSAAVIIWMINAKLSLFIYSLPLCALLMHVLTIHIETIIQFLILRSAQWILGTYMCAMNCAFGQNQISWRFELIGLKIYLSLVCLAFCTGRSCTKCSCDTICCFRTKRGHLVAVNPCNRIKMDLKANFGT